MTGRDTQVDLVVEVLNSILVKQARAAEAEGNWARAEKFNSLIVKVNEEKEK